HRADDVGRHVLEHAVGEHHVDLAVGEPRTGGVGGRAVTDDPAGRFLQPGTGIDRRAQVDVPGAHLLAIDAGGGRDRVDEAAQLVDAAPEQFRPQVAGQVEGGD